MLCRGSAALFLCHTVAVFLCSAVRSAELVSVPVYLFIFVNTFYTGLHVDTQRKELVRYLSQCPMADALYSREQVERWQKNLEEIAQAPRTTFTKKQAVETLIDTIEKALLTRSYDEVASGLKEWGLDISAGSLKQYVTRYRRAHPSNAVAGSHKRSGKAKKKSRAADATSSSASKNGSAKQTAEANKEKSAAKKSDSAGRLRERTQPGRFIGMDEENL